MKQLIKTNPKLLICIVVTLFVSGVIYFINNSNKPNIVVSLIEKQSFMETSHGPNNSIFPADISIILDDASFEEESPKLIIINKITIDDDKNFISSDELGPYPLYLGKGHTKIISRKIKLNHSVEKIKIETTDGTITVKPSTVIF